MPPARLLDLTRLVSRLDRGALTGVDRVELAYLNQFLKGGAGDGAPLFAWVQTGAGPLLLDAAGAAWVAAAARGQAAAGPADLLGRLTRRSDPRRARAEAELRRRALGWGLRGALLRRLPPGFAYYNTGHSNLSDRGLAAIAAAGGHISVLLHDVIPLDYPQFTRADIPPVFARKLAAVGRHAGRVIHTTAAARARSDAQLARLGRVPPGIVAPLGVPVAAPAAVALPGLVPGRRYFMAVGTIEPRKNHAFLLDLWQALAARLPPADLPQLVIAGGRGWANAAVFARLDARPPGVIEAPGLSDGALVTLLQGSAGLLFPSLAEGFGLPPAEAAALGVPVIANPLPELREVLGDYPVYLPVTDSYSWLETIERTMPQADRAHRFTPPRWEDHFNTVLNDRL